MSATPMSRLRTIEDADSHGGHKSQFATSGALSALQALVFSLAVVILPAVAAFLSASSPAGEGGGWGRSVTIATGLWLLGHGVPLIADGATFSLVPLGLTALAVFACFASARRSSYPSLVAWLVGIGVYAAATTGIAALTGSTTTQGVITAAAGGAVVAGLGLGAGIMSRADAPSMSTVLGKPHWVPPSVGRGFRAGLVSVALLMATSAGLVAAWAIAGRAQTRDMVTALTPGVVGGAVLAVAQIVVVPNLVVWAGTWLVGPGFQVGEGSHFATHGFESGPIPAIPVLGALPGPTWTNSITVFAPVIVVVIGVIAGFFVVRCYAFEEKPSWFQVLLAALSLMACCALAIAALVFLSSGSVGSGRLRTVGADAWWTGLLTAAEVGGGAILVLTWWRFEVTRRIGALFRSTTSRTRDTEPAEPVEL